MALVADRAAELLDLAGRRSPEDRERLLNALADECGPGGRDDDRDALLGEIFRALVKETEHDIRKRLAARLADAPWAPHALLMVLALDEIEIAGPIISRSPLLGDSDLLRLLIETTLEHRIAVARRPELSAQVGDALVDGAEPPVLSALARNPSAQLTPRAMEALVQAARELADLRAPLTRHPRLNEAMAQLLHAWVGAALRQGLEDRFMLEPGKLDTALVDVMVGETSPRLVSSVRAAEAEDEDRADRRLVDKLHESGQLRPGWLLKVLRERRLRQFELGLAALCETTPEAISAAIRSDRPELLATALLGAGVDQGAYGTLLTDLRDLTGGWPRTGQDSARKVAVVFVRHDGDPDSARQAFQAQALAA